MLLLDYCFFFFSYDIIRNTHRAGSNTTQYYFNYRRRRVGPGRAISPRSIRAGNIRGLTRKFCKPIKYETRRSIVLIREVPIDIFAGRHWIETGRPEDDSHVFKQISNV